MKQKLFLIKRKAPLIYTAFNFNIKVVSTVTKSPISKSFDLWFGNFIFKNLKFVIGRSYSYFDLPVIVMYSKKFIFQRNCNENITS